MTRVNLRRRLPSALYLALLLLLIGLPAMGGFAAPLLWPQFPGIDDGLWPWTPLLALVFTVVLALLDGPIERFALLFGATARRSVTGPLEAVFTLLAAALLYGLTMASYQATLIAAVTCVVLYLILTPLLGWVLAHAPASAGQTAQD
ncbi:hypothetical protein [Glutamicibacter endophyticus]|uniref:hypothetical protein n=1 Tax=Glutamicibacter endophyticus TaxID=1522174 RepID=UPI003AF064EC